VTTVERTDEVETPVLVPEIATGIVSKKI